MHLNLTFKIYWWLAAAILDRPGQEEGQQPGQGCGCWARDLNSTPSFTEASKTLRGEMNVQGWGACTKQHGQGVCLWGRKQEGGWRRRIRPGREDWVRGGTQRGGSQGFVNSWCGKGREAPWFGASETFETEAAITGCTPNLILFSKGFPGGTSGKEPSCQCRKRKRHGFDPWVGEMPWRRAWQLILVFLPGESHGQRSLVGYSP